MQQWVKLWSQVLTDITADGVTGNRVIVDILNEPDAANFQCAYSAVMHCLLSSSHPKHVSALDPDWQVSGAFAESHIWISLLRSFSAGGVQPTDCPA